MRLQFLDLAILASYLVLMLIIGWYFRKKARQNQESYQQKTANNSGGH